MGCVESNPIVKWVRKKVGSEVNFLRMDISTAAAKDVMRKFDIPINSAYIIFDSSGSEVWRSYAIPFNGKKAVNILNSLLEP